MLFFILLIKIEQEECRDIIFSETLHKTNHQTYDKDNSG